MSFAVKIIFWIPCNSFIVERDHETNNYLESFNLIHWRSTEIYGAYYRNSISRNNIIVCCLGLFVHLWLSKGLFHIFYLAIFSVFFVLPLTFPPCIGQEEETRTQQAFAALMAISYTVVIVESRSSLELQYLKNLLVSFLERQRHSGKPHMVIGLMFPQGTPY